MLKIIILSVLFFSQQSIASCKDEDRLDQEYAQKYPGKTRPTRWSQHYPVYRSYYQPCPMERLTSLELFDQGDRPEKNPLTKSELEECLAIGLRINRMIDYCPSPFDQSPFPERLFQDDRPEKKILTKSELIEHIVSDRKIDRMMSEDRWHVESIEELAELESLSLEQIITREEAIQAKKLRILDRIVDRILDNIK